MSIITRINRLFAESCGYLLFLVTILIALDVILRNCGIAVFGTTELAMYLVIAAVFFGLGHCEENDEHVRITLLLSRLPLKYNHLLRFFTAICSLAIMIFACYAAFLSALKSYNGNEAVMANNIAMYAWPARTCIYIGLLGYCFQLLVTIKYEFTQFIQARRKVEE